MFGFSIKRSTLIQSPNLLCCCAAEPLPIIPDDAYHACIFVRHRTLEIAFTAISLLYGVSDLL